MLQAFLHRIIAVVTFISIAGAAMPAWAGELLLGAQPFEVGDDGKVTSAGRNAALKSIEAEPGDASWVLHLWGKIDRGAVGPMYIEFHREHAGRRLMAHRDEYDDYGGEKYFTHTVEISRQEGFRPGETIEVALVQTLDKGDVTHAKTKVELKQSSRPAPEPPREAEAPDEDEPNDDDAGDPAPSPSASTEPPPIEPASKKGCRIGTSTPDAFGLLLVLAAALRRRRWN